MSLVRMEMILTRSTVTVLKAGEGEFDDDQLIKQEEEKATKKQSKNIAQVVAGEVVKKGKGEQGKRIDKFSLSKEEFDVANKIMNARSKEEEDKGVKKIGRRAK